MDSEAQPRPPNPCPAAGEGLDQTATTASAPEARPPTERKRRIQWGNFKGPQAILAVELPTYLSLETGKKEWVAELANRLVKDETFMDPLTEKGHNAGDVRNAIWNWYHNHTPRVTKKAIPSGKNPLWAAFTKRKVSPSRLYIKRELEEILKETGGKKDIGLIAKVAVQQYSRLPLEQRQKWEKEAEEVSKPREDQCYNNQLHAMPVFGDLFTKLIGPGDKQLGNCAFYLRFIYVDERGVSVEEEMCVSANTSLEPYTSTPDPDWNRWSKNAVNPHASPIAADDEEAWASSPGVLTTPGPVESSSVGSSCAMSTTATSTTASSATSPPALSTPAPLKSAPSTLASSTLESLTSERPNGQDAPEVPSAPVVPRVGLSTPAPTVTCPSTPMSARRTRRAENIPELPALNHVESLDWLRGIVQSHLESQWRDAGWESPLDWMVVEGDRERYLTCASFWQRHETLCPPKLEIFECMSFYSDLATAWNIDKTPFFKDARNASQPTPRRRVVSITPRTPRSPQTPSKLHGPRFGDIQLPAPLTLARAVLSRRSSSSTLPSTPQRHRESSGMYLDPADFIPMDSVSLGLTHVYAENNNLPAPWEVLDSVTSPAPATAREPASIAPSASAGVSVEGDAAPPSAPSPAPPSASSPIPATAREPASVASSASAGVSVEGDAALASAPSPAPPTVREPATRGRGRGCRRGRGYGQVLGERVSMGRTTRSKTQNATGNANSNGANVDANMGTHVNESASANADITNGASGADGNASARHSSGSFKLKLTNNTTILAITGAPPQHVVRVAGETGDGMKRKRKASDSGGSRKCARAHDENHVQLADSGDHNRPQRNRAPARPRSAMPRKAS